MLESGEDALYLARRMNNQLVYAGKMERAGVKKLAEIEPIMRRLDELATDKPPLKMEMDKPRARWVEPILKAHVVHRGGKPPRPVRHGIFEGWDETPEAQRLLDVLRTRIAQSAITKKPTAAPTIARGAPADRGLLAGSCGAGFGELCVGGLQRAPQFPARDPWPGSGTATWHPPWDAG